MVLCLQVFIWDELLARTLRHNSVDRDGFVRLGVSYNRTVACYHQLQRYVACCVNAKKALLEY